LKNNITKKIVIGTWPLSGDFGKINTNDCEKILEYAVSEGFQEFDTAPNYGKGKIQKLLSKILKTNKNLRINTKCGYNKNFKKTFKEQDILDSVKKSLDLFGSINILYLHNPRNEIKNWDKIIDLLNDLKKKKLIKFTGISLARDYKYSSGILNKFDNIQDEINLLRHPKTTNLKKLKKDVYARSPYASGILNSNFSVKKKFQLGDHRKSWLTEKRIKNIYSQKKMLEKICNGNIEEYALKFVLKSSYIKKVIVGVKKIHHIDFIKETHNKNNIKITKNFIKDLNQIYDMNFGLDKKEKLY